MDIPSHGLWPAAISKAVNLKIKKPLKPWLAFCWGVFPDLFAFTIPFIWLITQLIVGNMSLSEFPRPSGVEPTQLDGPFSWAPHLYNISHSFIIFIIAFGVIWFIRKKPVWEILAWPLHILADIPTHTTRFYSTPYLWPLPHPHINGHPWNTPTFLSIDYGLLLLMFGILWFLKHKKKIG